MILEGGGANETLGGRGGAAEALEDGFQCVHHVPLAFLPGTNKTHVLGI